MKRSQRSHFETRWTLDMQLNSVVSQCFLFSKYLSIQCFYDDLMLQYDQLLYMTALYSIIFFIALFEEWCMIATDCICNLLLLIINCNLL